MLEESSHTYLNKTMTDYTIAIYCFMDDYLRIVQPARVDARRKTNDAQILTIGILSAQYFYGNQHTAYQYMRQHHGMAQLDKSNLNRHLHRLTEVLISLFMALGRSLKELNTQSRYLIDSFPVAVCKNIRIKRNKLLKGEEVYRGYNASKKQYFYGFKVQVVTTEEGTPVDYYITAGSIHDNTALQAMHLDLPEGSEVYADSAYLNYEEEDLYEECEQMRLLVERKSNSKRKDSASMRFLKKYYRKRIETSFSEITAHFPNKIHAVTPQGFLLKIILFIFAFTFKKTLSATWVI